MNWKGGPVSGVIAPDRRMGMRLVADGAAPGLQPSALPSPQSIPNNHLFYAVQWFAFAAIALIIYGLALRKRLKERSAE
jgi:surfeit locus 1 family protein